jgi:hypothetical protein
MKKVFFSLAIAAMFAFVACGPSAEEVKKQHEADSIAQAQAEQTRLDSIAAIEKAKADSIAAIAAKAKEDSIAAAEAGKKGKKK